MRNILYTLVGMFLFSGIAETGLTQTQSDYALVRQRIIISPEIWEINKDLTNSEFGVDLFHYPRTGVFTYDRNTTNSTLRSSLFAVIDQSWNRMIYSEFEGGFINSYGSFGTGSCQFKWPRSIVAYALSDGVTSLGIYNIFIADTHNDRVSRAEYHPYSDIVVCAAPITGSGLYKPIDIAVDIGGTHVDDSDDKIWVLNDNSTLLRFSNLGVLEYTIDLCEHLGATTIATAIAINNYCDPDYAGPWVAVTIDGNNEIWEFYKKYNPEYEPWPPSTMSALYPVVDMQYDALGHLWALNDENGVFIKYNEFYPEALCRFGSSGTGSNQFSMPSGFSIGAGVTKSGDVFVMEDWSATTGIQRYAIGTDVIDIEASSNPERSMHSIDFVIIDPSLLTVAVYDEIGQVISYVTRPGAYHGWAGRHYKIWDGTYDAGGQVPTGVYTYSITAESIYAGTISGPVNEVTRTGTIYHVAPCPEPLSITDPDNDRVCVDNDNCPYVYNPAQTDTDGDGIGDLCCCAGNVGDVNCSGVDIPSIRDVSVVLNGT